jgi:hypothetical protein
MSKYLPTEYQQFIHLSRYSKFDYDKNRRETWEETVDRFIEFHKTSPEVGQKLKANKGILEDIRKSVLNLEDFPSMRSLMAAGKAAERDQVSLYNCAFDAVDHPRAFDEALYILMCGTGYGFSVERQHVSKLPEVPEELHPSESIIIVRDSKIGWAAALKELIAALYSGSIPKWDVSKLRPAGAVLKTFGGRSSGPDPLVDLFKFVVATFQKAKGRKLESIECHDIMCKIGDIVVVGGVRRSALISLSNLSDLRMREAKSGQWWEANPQRALANNSVSYTQKPDIGLFMDEWKALYASKSGERGIFNREAAKKSAELYGRDPSHEFGTNPCVTGDTLVLTDKGHKRIAELVSLPVKVWNGEFFAEVRPFSTGINSIWRVTLSDGSHLDCTPYHNWCVGEKFIQTQSLNIGDKLDKFKMPVVEGEELDLVEAYSQGFYSGDGNTNLNHSWVYFPKFSCIPFLKGEVEDKISNKRKVWKHGKMLPKNFVPYNGVKTKLAWLAGLLDSDGTVTKDKNGSGFQITATDCVFLQNVKLMLTTLGVNAKVVVGTPSRKKLLPDGRGGNKEYVCKETKRLLIGNTDAYHLMNLGLKNYIHRIEHNNTPPQRDARRFVTVTSIENLNKTEETFCFTEPYTSRGTFNGIVTGQCGEIILRPGQFCNLTEVVARPDDTEKSLLKKIEMAAVSVHEL